MVWRATDTTLDRQGSDAALANHLMDSRNPEITQSPNSHSIGRSSIVNE